VLNEQRITTAAAAKRAKAQSQTLLRPT
jgi:hypothetical protein